ncbi:hypothetical protein [Proteus phage PM2]|uniref:Uncharacterized protein n=1 Tax=Proteus phage PM2 TaxID=2025809 RepID=A0A249XWM1_9CAUD|nr:hypothetical protein KNT71_gp257 [Proteus phage PM2]ASZ76375.1 hypothetical protein [Proteus phage PM2]
MNNICKNNMKTNVFMDLFTSKEDICNEFQIPPDVLADKEIVLAYYDCEDYCGCAIVIYVDTLGQFWEVHGSHCSCYGLEGQWEPELIGDFELFKEYSKTQQIDFGKGSIYSMLF